MGKKSSLKTKMVKVHKVGGSLMITLPPELAKIHSINEGDEISLTANHTVQLDVSLLEAKTDIVD